MALKKGTIPVVDSYLIQAVKYALDQLGIHPESKPAKKRRTNLDGTGYGDGGNTVVRGVNRTGKTLYKHQAVSLYQEEYLLNDDLKQTTFEIREVTKPPYGIIQSQCEPDRVAKVQVSGLSILLATRPIPPYFSVLGGDVRRLCYIDGNCYNGYFAVFPIGYDNNQHITKVYISSGLTDVSLVQETELNIPGNSKYICLKLTANTFSGTDDFKGLSESFECLDREPNENKPYVIIAEITDYGRSITQRWTAGRIYWRNRFIVPQYGDF